MHLRRFVLGPLADLDPGLVHPGLGIRVGDLLLRVPPGRGIRLVARDWFLARAGERCVP
jgi:7,8-dihydro-6-hydroxymethylpterin-pyrophosphokinase